uniref:Uncharacterized protein n=1 Tax=Solanum lycopersicum TaxID=4081 RepID=A0A3Q7EET8_SOLLC
MIRGTSFYTISKTKGLNPMDILKNIQQKTKKSTIHFTSSNTWSNSRYNSKSKTCRWIESSSSH